VIAGERDLAPFDPFAPDVQADLGGWFAALRRQAPVLTADNRFHVRPGFALPALTELFVELTPRRGRRVTVAVTVVWLAERTTSRRSRPRARSCRRRSRG
jgi:hypothetical protein